MEQIDIVIPWVDGSDPEWQRDFKKYAALSMGRDNNTEIRYRDWDNLQYLFRGIEKFAPWVNKVHLITSGQKPHWLNMNAPKLNFVSHSDFIPEEWLPTFSVRPIELNLHRIEGLSDFFVYFNDDYFILDDITPDMFFKEGLPCDLAVGNVILPTVNARPHVHMNTMSVINKYFSKKRYLKSNFKKVFNLRYGTLLWRTLMVLPYGVLSGFYNPHTPQPFLKKTFNELWEKEIELLSEVSSHKFRDTSDVNQYLMRYWQLASGSFYPYNVLRNTFHSRIDDDSLLLNKGIIEKKAYKMIILNDTDNISDFEYAKETINGALDLILPDKSSFEV